MANSAHQDQLADPDQPTDLDLHCKGRVYPGSSGQGLKSVKINILKYYHTHGCLGNTVFALGSQ